MKSVNVSQLKAHLSQHLAGVRRGARLVVLDRRTPIALLVPYEDDSDVFEVNPPVHPRSDLMKIEGVRLRRSLSVGRVLQESRDDR